MNMKRLLYAIWVIAFVLGLIGIYERLYFGHEKAAYGSYVTWGLWVAIYIYFIGLSAGAFLISSLVYVFGVKRLEKIGKPALFVALITLLMALFSIWFDLGHMGRFWKVYTSPNFYSMLAWMIWFYTIYFILLLIEFWLVIRADLVRWSTQPGFRGKLSKFLTFGSLDLSETRLAKDRKLIKRLGTMGVPLAVAFIGGEGALFGVVGARPHWHSAIYPILFLSGALLSGGALLAAATAIFWPQKSSQEYRILIHDLGRITLGLLVLYLILEWAEFSITLWGSIPSHVAGFKLIMFGQYWWVFWIVHLLLGSLLPLALLAIRPKSVALVGIATALIAITFVSVRLNIVIPGLAWPELKGLMNAYMDHRLSFQYFPSLHEWLVSLFIVTLGIGLFYVGYKNMPIFEEKEALTK
jgi:molybdopterin-containing oxidoreductase family membrane subunit